MSNLDFYVATKDDGTSVADSIQPVTNAEPANETVLQRPSENLRTRTQAIKDSFDKLEAVQAMDRSWIAIPSVASDVPTLTWSSGAGTIVSSANGVTIIPAFSGHKTDGGVGAVYKNPQIHFYNGILVDLTIEAYNQGTATPIYMHTGAGNIFFKLTDAADPASIVTTGTDPAVETVTVEVTTQTGVTTFNDLAALINGDPVASNVLKMTVLVGGASVVSLLGAAFIAATATRQRLHETATYGAGGMDSTAYVIPQATWATVTGLLEGDVLAVKFATPTLMRSKDGAGTIGAADLVILGASGQYGTARNYIGSNYDFPLVKIVGGEAYFFNGIRLYDGVATEVVLDPTTQTSFSAHVAGTADKHPMLAITEASRTFLVVGGGTGCDYSTIDAAVAALGISGGTIYVQPGTYTLAGTLSFNKKSIRLIGQSKESVIVVGDGVNDMLYFYDNMVNPHPDSYISGITFQQPVATEPIVLGRCTAVPKYSSSLQKMIHFDKCAFYRITNPAAGALGLVDTNISMKFTNCFFFGNSSVTDVAISMQTDTDEYLDMEVDHCRFLQCQKVVHVQPGGGHPVGRLSVTDCNFQNCGHSDGPATWGYLIYDENAAGGTFDISRNNWDANTSGATTQCGGLCYLYGAGKVEGNYLGRVVTEAVTAADSWAIRALSDTISAPTFASGLIIRGNTVSVANAANRCCGGINGAFIIDNIIQEFCPRDAVQAAIQLNGNGGVCSGNVINGNTALDTAGTIYILTLQTGIALPAYKVIDNLINMTATDSVGILLGTGCYHSLARGNTIFSDVAITGTTGIDVNTTDCSVIENKIVETIIGIDISGARTHARGNSVTITGGPANSIGIAITGTTASYCKISDNFVTEAVLGIEVILDTAAGVGATVNGNTVVAGANTLAGVFARAAAAGITADVSITNNHLYGAGAMGTSGILIATLGAAANNFAVGGNFIRNWASDYTYSAVVGAIGMMHGSPSADPAIITELHAKNWTTP